MNSKKLEMRVRALMQTVVVLALICTSAAIVTPASAATPPANDDFFSAKKFIYPSGGQSMYDMTASTTDPDDPFLTCDGFGQGEASIWYTYTPATSGEITLSTANSAYDTIITVFMAEEPSDPFTLFEVGCNDDATFLTTTSSLTMAVRGAVKYYFEVVRKSGTAVSTPDALRFSYSFVSKPILLPGVLYDGSDDEIIYSPVGWLLFPVLPGYTYMGNVHIGNNPGDSVTIFFDGSGVQVCYVTGPQMGNMNAYIDGVFVATIGQGSGTYNYTCWDTPFLPIFGSSSLVEDNVHKLVLQHAGPAGTKVNIDTFEVYYQNDFIPPGYIYDLTATPTTGVGRVGLKWTATGDDFYMGRVTANEVRYSLDPIVDEPSWDAATPYVVSGVPLYTAGKLQTVVIAGLVPNLTYHFNVRGVDDVGNIGDLSDDVTAVATGGTPVGIGTYDDKSSYWSYTGTWSVVSSPGNINNYIHVANQLGSTASLYFTGTQFRLYYNTGLGMGLMDLYLDGVYLTTIDEDFLYTVQMTYVSPILTLGPHLLKLVQKTVPYINFDGAAVFIIDDGGPPDHVSDLTAFPGFDAGTVDLFWTAPGDDPGGVGRASLYEVRYSTSPILTDADFSAATTATGIIPAPQDAGFIEGMTVTGLAPGVDYWFAVHTNDNAGYTDLSNTDTAAASIGSLSYMPSGWYENDDPAWLFNGLWSYIYSASASGGSISSSGYTGSTAAFLFTGNGFTIYYQTGRRNGVLGVFIDGLQVGSINQKNRYTQYQLSRTWNVPFGNHTVQFITSGPGNVDAIEILP